MLPHRRVRLPISTRHAFALAFDLAFRRDALHSLIVPLLLRAPWILALAALPKPSDTDRPGLVFLLTLAALIGDFLTLVMVGAMLRFRARSVFNTPMEVRPAPATDCYALGLTRVPWLVVTEIIRNLALLFGFFFFVLPGVFLGFRLSFATEAVVLHEPHTQAAFRCSFRLTPGRFERWLEMIVVSVGLALAAVFAAVVLSLVYHDISLGVWVAVAQVLVAAIIPVVQYAWTFFYLRLVEVDVPYPGVEVGPAYVAASPPGTESGGRSAALPGEASPPDVAPLAAPPVSAPNA
jgi:hypothetical protein